MNTHPCNAELHSNSVKISLIKLKDQRDQWCVLDKTSRFSWCCVLLQKSIEFYKNKNVSVGNHCDRKLVPERRNYFTVRHKLLLQKLLLAAFYRHTFIKHKISRNRELDQHLHCLECLKPFRINCCTTWSPFVTVLDIKKIHKFFK